MYTQKCWRSSPFQFPPKLRYRLCLYSKLLPRYERSICVWQTEKVNANGAMCRENMENRIFNVLIEITPSDIRVFFQKGGLFKHLTIENVKMT